jgi:hypothetical protein
MHVTSATEVTAQQTTSLIPSAKKEGLADQRGAVGEA